MARQLGRPRVLLPAHRERPGLRRPRGAGASGLTRSKLAVVVVFVVAIAAFFAAGGHRYFSFENLRAQQAALEGWRETHPQGAALGFFALYIACTSLSLPAATILTVLAGAIFGLGPGTLIVSFASAIGATIAMLAARFVLRDWVQ